MHTGRSGGIDFVIYIAILAILYVATKPLNIGFEGLITLIVISLALGFIVIHLAKKLGKKISGGSISLISLAHYGVGLGELDVEQVQEEMRQSIHSFQQEEEEPVLQLPSPPARQPAVTPVHSQRSVQFNDSLLLAPTFAHPLSDFINQNVLFIGDRRTGKSNGLGRLAEQEASFLVPLVVFDTQGDYTSLAHPEFFPRGVLVGSERMAREYKRMRVLPLTVESAHSFGRTIVREGLQAVVDLRYFRSEQGPFFDNPAAQIITAIIDGIDSWEREQEDQDRVSCSIYLDEAHLWVPQQAGDTTMKLSPDVYDALSTAIFTTLVRMGGKMGEGLRLATQRIVEIDKRALQSYWAFVYRQSLQNDQDRVQKSYGIPGEEVRVLSKGECFIIGPEIRTKVKMYERHSHHGGDSPTMEHLLNHQRRNQTRTVASVLDRYSAPVLPIQQRVAPVVQVSQQQSVVVPTPTVKTTAALYEYVPFGPIGQEPEPPKVHADALPQPGSQEQLKAAALYWNDGHNSVRKLMSAMGLGFEEARFLRKQLKAQHLVTDSNDPIYRESGD